MKNHPWRDTYGQHLADVINARRLKNNPLLIAIDYILENQYGDTQAHRVDYEDEKVSSYRY